nr:hypothetical protein [Limimaricola sp.]
MEVFVFRRPGPGLGRECTADDFTDDAARGGRHVLPDVPGEPRGGNGSGNLVKRAAAAVQHNDDRLRLVSADQAAAAKLGVGDKPVQLIELAGKFVPVGVRPDLKLIDDGVNGLVLRQAALLSAGGAMSGSPPNFAQNSSRSLLRGIAHHLDHLVAGPEPQLFQCDFGRKGTCPAKAGSDHFE